MSAPVERRAARAVDDAVARLAAAVREQAPSARVSVAAGAVSVVGRGVADDPALRWPAGLLR